MKERGELGGEWAGSGLCVEGLKEIGRRKGCCTRNTFKLQFMRSRNRERDLAYVAWKGEAWGIGRRKSCFQINSRILHNVAERPFVACHLKLRLFPPVASTNVRLSGLPWAQHNYQNLPFLESPFRVRNIVTSSLLATSKARMKRANMRANQDLENRRDFGEHAAEGGNNCGFDEHTIEGGNKRDFGEHATVGGKMRNFGEHATNKWDATFRVRIKTSA